MLNENQEVNKKIWLALHVLIMESHLSEEARDFKCHVWYGLATITSESTHSRNFDTHVVRRTFNNSNHEIHTISILHFRQYITSNLRGAKSKNPHNYGILASIFAIFSQTNSFLDGFPRPSIFSSFFFSLRKTCVVFDKKIFPYSTYIFSIPYALYDARQCRYLAYR